MKTFRGIELSLLLFLLPACGQRLVEIAKPGPPDGGATDAKTSEARTSEAGIPEVGNPDVTSPDVGNPDVTSPDVGNPDVGNPDVGNPDVANPDGGSTDAGTPDARAAGGETPSAGNSDVANSDVANPDVANSDVANPDVETPNPGNPDVANPDVENPNPGNPDVASLDAAEIDAATAANPDAGNIDAEDIDAVDIDTANIDTAEPIIVINLGLATPYAIAATAGVTNTPTEPITHINGDVVLDPTPTCNHVPVGNAGNFGLCGGMPPIISGTVITNLYPDTTTSTAIRAALSAAFLSITPLAGPPAVGTLGGGTLIGSPTTLGAGAGSALVLGDNWFTPGVYTSITSILITDDITLDGQGDPNAVFVFQSASSLTTADGAASPGAHVRILLTNGTKASNVWWQVASSATIGTYSEIQGNILAAFDITMKTGATACGRSMAGAWVGGYGAFVFDSNVVSVPGNGCPM
jgi:Ice-binding-like